MDTEGRSSCEFLNERFEVYFFLYFVAYVLVWRLNFEYISAKYIHQLQVDTNQYSDYYFNITTKDQSNLLLPRTAADVGHLYCNNTTVAYLDSHAMRATVQLMEGTERNQLKIYAALLIPSITVTIIFGLLSDFTGKRKFMMSTSSFSNALYALVIVVDYYLGSDVGVRNLVIGAVAAGFFGNWAATTVALITYVADVTKPRERFFRVSIVILLMKGAYAACEGPLVYWIKARGFHEPIWFTFAMAGVACSIIVQVMDESQATNRDYRPFNVGFFLYWLKTTNIKATFDKYFNFLVISYSFFVFITEGYYVRVIYKTFTVTVCGHYNKPFGYMHYIVWNLMGCVGMIAGIVPICRRIPDIILAITGMVSIAIGLVFIPFCTDEWMFYTAFAVMFLHMIPYSVYLTLSSKHTDTDIQAIALTFLYCCGGISKLLAIVFNHFVFHEVHNANSGAILLWIHAALLVFPAGFLIVLWKKNGEKEQKVDSKNKRNGHTNAVCDAETT